MMPGMDGFELTRQLKQNKYTMSIPVIILSAKNSSQEKIVGFDAGADAYIGKPFEIDYLKAIVVRLIENRSKLKIILILLLVPMIFTRTFGEG